MPPHFSVSRGSKSRSSWKTSLLQSLRARSSRPGESPVEPSKLNTIPPFANRRADRMSASPDIHAASIVIDGTCPLLRRHEFVDWYIEGGVTACCPTVGSTAPAEETLRNLGAWHRFIGARADLVLVREAADIETAK